MAADTGNQASSDRRLNSWKEIAAFFGKDERTVKRWEVQRGLPVHRLPGGSRKTVFGYVTELEAWLRGPSDAAPAAALPEPQQGPRSETGSLTVPAPASTGDADRGRRMAIAAGFGALALILALVVGVIGRAGVFLSSGGAVAGGASAHEPPPAARDLYLTGVYHWERRTPDGLRRSVDLFNRAIEKDPAYADAYVGLANAYNLLSQYTVMPAEAAYPLAEAAAEHALKLAPRSAAAFSALAFTTFYWSHDTARAEALFKKSLALDPSSSRTYHWYALALMHTGNLDEPVRAITRAQQLDPVSRSVLANKGLIYFYAGRTDEALGLLRDLTLSAPEFQPPHFYLATIYLDQGRYPDYLEESRKAAQLSGNNALAATIAAGTQGYAQGGAPEMFARMLDAQETQHRAGQESAFNVARTAALAGAADTAFAYLEKSLAAHEPDMLGIRIDPSLKSLRSDPRFGPLAESAFAPRPRALAPAGL